MKSAIKTIALIGVLLASTPSFSNEGMYINGNLGVAVPTDNDVITGNSVFASDSGFAFDFAFGYEFKENIRTEIEFGYKQNDIFAFNNGNNTTNDGIGTFTLLTNGYYVFNNPSKFVPYLGLGIGYSHVFDDSFSINSFAYQFGGGLDYFINEKVSIGIKYQFTGIAEKIEFLNTMNSNNVYAGMRFYF